ncbi:MAG: glycosyltransferase family 4 protein [Candidatus Pacebacteria bacterium]|jgi:glycosyltransferase involved in cell wall biosynthesis|nr:glycosyltransferase family 4 protein [Candidatus Paceibacterota bacterium]
MIDGKPIICFFGDAAARHLWRWTRYFAQQGYQVHVVTLNGELVDDYGPVKVHVIKKTVNAAGPVARLANIVPAFFAAKMILRKVRPDIIHGQDLGGNSWLAALCGFHPLIVTPWGSDVLIHAKADRVARMMTGFALRRADLVVCDGENTKEAVKNFGIPEEKIKLFTFGVDIDKFKPPAGDAARGKAVVSTRFLTPVHDVETLVRAAAIVIRKVPEAKFVLVGDGEQKGYLQKLATDLGIAGNIEFSGRVSEARMVSCLQTADIYVSTSLSESGLAASTAEAMACELPVINTDSGDIRLWIKDGEGGFVIPLKDYELLAEKILYLFDNDAARAAFGKINRAVIWEKNNYYKEMAGIDAIYRRMIGNKNHGHEQ